MRVKTLYFICLILFSSCIRRNPDIIHLDFLDQIGIQPPAYSSEKMDSSLVTRDLYYLVDESKAKNIKDSMIWNFIKTDEFIQQEIHKNYFQFSILFYHQSVNTDLLMKYRSSRYLLDCNEDEISEYEWNQSKFSGVLHFDNGILRGSESIILEDINHHGR